MLIEPNRERNRRCNFLTVDEFGSKDNISRGGRPLAD
jgi:hypothetical protein